MSALVTAAPSKVGKQLYESNCSICHGSDGMGGVGVPLALPAFLKGVDNAYLKKTIKYGRPGRVMPAFSWLSDKQIAQIVTYVRSWQKAGKSVVFSRKKVTGNISAGKKLFAAKCASCHGASGKGGAGTGVTFSRPRDLPIIAPALGNSGFLKSASDSLIRHTIINGRKGTPMPTAAQLGMKDGDVNNVVAYIRSLAKSSVRKKSTDVSPVVIYESSYSLKQTVENVKNAAKGKNFRIIRVQTLDQGLAKKGKENQSKVIIYFCNFSLLNKALAIDPRVGLFLPCRVTVVKRKGKVYVVSVNPALLSKLFNNAELDKLCDEMGNMYREIIEEATL